MKNISVRDIITKTLIGSLCVEVVRGVVVVDVEVVLG